MKTVNFLEADCCSAAVIKRRTLLPGATGEPDGIFEKSLKSVSAKQRSIEFKCELAKRIINNPEKFEFDIDEQEEIQFKVGAITSPAPGMQYVQGLGSSIVPGNLTRYRRPVRSASWSALTPGGSNRGILGRLGASAYGAVKPERGFRCQEGFQFGGQFTNEQFSTCGRQIFSLPAMLLGRALRGSFSKPRGSTRYQSLAYGSYSQQMYDPSTSISKRSPDIPKVGLSKLSVRSDAEKAVYDSFDGVDQVTARLVRKDGFVLEPVVSPAVLRTVPDNRNMENSTYIMSVFSPKEIGNDELGLLSNSGVDKIAYVFPNGGVVELKKNRKLTVGERRKLGKTVSTAQKISIAKDPTVRLKFVSSEMGDGIGYVENLKVKNPNDLISVGQKNGSKKLIRRWYYEVFAKNNKPAKIQKETSNTSKEKSVAITTLTGAIKHLNQGGNISNIAPSMRFLALKRSALYKQRKFGSGANLFERGDGLTLFEIKPKNDFEHIYAGITAELQQSLGVAAPEVYSLGAGRQSSYLITQAQDSFGKGSINRNSFESLPMEDMLAITVSDWLMDTKLRDPSNVQPVKISGAMRAVPGSNPGASSSKNRTSVSMPDFFKRDLRDQWRNYFEKLQTNQKRKVLELLTALLERASSVSPKEIAARLNIDNTLSSAEKNQIDIYDTIYTARLGALRNSRKLFSKIIGAAE